MAFASLHGADQLAWQRAKLPTRTIEVNVRDQLAANLQFQGGNLRCDATCAEGAWTFLRVGFLWRHVIIEIAGTGQRFGMVRTGFVNGVLVLEDGKRYAWKRLRFWSGESGFVTESGFPIVRFLPKRFSLKDAGSVSVQREYKTLSELSCLVLLGVFLSVVNQRRRRA